MLYCSGDNDKKKSLYMFSTDTTIVGLTTQHVAATTYLGLGNIFDPTLAEPMDVELEDMEPQDTDSLLCIYQNSFYCTL